MEVSVIIPTFNVAPFIVESLRRMAAQSFTDFECIIVDDGSTDSTVRIVRSLLPELGPRFSLHVMPENSGGPYQPRKLAISLAQAPLVAPIDADDVVEPDYLESLVKRMQATSADIVYPDMYRYDGEHSYKILPLEDFDAEGVHEGRSLVKDTLGRWRFGAGGGLIRKRLYLECFNKYDSSVAYTFSDEVLTRQLLIAAEKVAFSRTPYHYRMNPDSATTRVAPSMFMLTRSHRAIVETVKSAFPADSPTVLAAEIQLFHGFFDAVRLLARTRACGSATPSLNEIAMTEISETWHCIDWSLVRPHVSPLYYHLGRLGIRTTLFILPLYDKIKG